MRKPYVLTAVLAVGVATFTYACTDDSKPIGVDDPQPDAGEAGTKKPDSSTSEPEGDSGSDSGKDSGTSDAGDAGDGGDGGQPPEPHKVVVTRIAQLDGGTLGMFAAPVFIDEYELDTNTRVRSIALPTEKNGDNRALVQTPAEIKPTEGAIALSADGHSVAVTGYSDSSGFPAFAPYAAAPRVVAKVKADGTVDTTTLLSDALATNFIGGAVISGNDVWLTGTGMETGPVQYLAFGNSLNAGATGGAGVVEEAPGDNTYYSLRIFDGQLYASSFGGSILRLGTGLPKVADQPVTPVAEGITGAFEFEFVDLDGQPGAERLYVAVDGSGEGISGGVKKFVYNANSQTWALNATFTSGVAAESGLRGLAAYKDGSNVVILATTKEGDKLLRYVDTGSGSPTATTIATAPAGVVFRGVSNAPKL
jgi:hypothetical protein